MSGERTVEEKSLISKHEPPENSLRFFWYVLGILSAVTFPVATGTSQALGDVIPLCQLIAVRYAAVFVFSAGLCGLFRLNVCTVFEKNTILYVIACILLDDIQLITLLLAVNYVPLTTMSCLKQTMEVILSFLVTYFIARVCYISRALSTCLCIVGVFLVTQPVFLFGGSELVSRSICGQQNERPISSSNVSGFNYSIINDTVFKKINSDNNSYLGYILSFLCSVASVILFFIASQKLHHINGVVLAFWYGLFNSVTMGCATVIFEKPSFPSGATCITLFFGHLVSLAFSHIMFTCAYINIPPVMMSILGSLELAVGLCAQYTVLKHVNPGHGNALEVIGAVVVMLGNIAGPFYQMFKLKQNVAKNEKEVINEMEILGEK